MWKIALGFIVFGALVMYVLMQGGEIDMSGEKHGIETHEPAPAAASDAPPPAVPASAASGS